MEDSSMSHLLLCFHGLWHTSCSLIQFFLTRWTYKKNKNFAVNCIIMCVYKSVIYMLDHSCFVTAICNETNHESQLWRTMFLGIISVFQNLWYTIPLVSHTHAKLWNNPNLEINFFNFWYNVTLPVMKSQASMSWKEFTLHIQLHWNGLGSTLGMAKPCNSAVNLKSVTSWLAQSHFFVLCRLFHAFFGLVDSKMYIFSFVIVNINCSHLITFAL
jgi:hypothetical protein